MLFTPATLVKLFSQVQAFLQGGQPGVAHGYESSSSGIIEMLEGLLDKFIAERTDLEKDESASKHAYNMLMQDLTAQVDNAKSAVSDKSGEKAGLKRDAGDAKDDKKSTTKTKDEDSKFLKSFKATCETKAADFEQNQQLRAHNQLLRSCLCHPHPLPAAGPVLMPHTTLAGMPAGSGGAVLAQALPPAPMAQSQPHPPLTIHLQPSQPHAPQPPPSPSSRSGGSSEATWPDS